MGRRFNILCLALMLGVLAPSICMGQAGATKIVLGFPPGTSLDAMTRMLANGIASTLNQTVVVENRAGDAARIATEYVKNAAPDGKTLLMTPFAPMVINPHLYAKLRYDPVGDFTPIAHVGSFDFAFAAGAHVPAKNLRDYIDAVKRDVKYGQYSTGGTGSLPHFLTLVLARDAGLSMSHVSYKGTAPALNDLMGGHIAAFMGTVADVRPLHLSGKIRALATSGANRSAALPDVPTFKESGFDNLVGGGWYGLYAPAKTPAPVVERISSAAMQFLRDPGVRSKLDAMGIEATGLAPSALAASQKADSAKWSPVIRASGLKIDD